MKARSLTVALGDDILGGNVEDLTVPVAGAERVRAVLGAWPSFHDAEVLRVELTRDPVLGRTPPVLLLELDAGNDFGTDAGGAPLPRVAARVALRFHDVADLVLGSFGYQNVLYELTLAPAGDRIAVVLDPTGGLGGVEGSFTCAAVEVVAAEVRPTTRALSKRDDG